MATKLKFGLLLPHFCEYGSAESCIEGAKKAEAYGFDSVWVRDHLVFEPHGIEGRDNTHIEGLLVLKTTGSAFFNYIRDQYTTLKETTDRVFATAIKANWVHSKPDAATGAVWQGVRQMILETFAQHDSLSVQQTLYAIGETVLENFDDITEISLSLPNRHCLLVDLSPFGMENNNEIFVPTDEPYGLIEARLRKG